MQDKPLPNPPRVGGPTLSNVIERCWRENEIKINILFEALPSGEGWEGLLYFVIFATEII